MAAAPQDRRKQRRKQVNLRVEFLIGDVSGKAMTVDVSETGLFLNTPQAAADGAEVGLRIHQNPPLPPVDARGVIRRVIKAGQGPLPGWGVEFIGAEGVDIVENLEHPPSPAQVAAAVSRQATEVAAAAQAKLIQERIARAKDVAFEGEKLLFKNDFKGAYSSYKLASVLDPKNAEYQSKVRLLEPRALRDGAVTKYDRALQLIEKGEETPAVPLLREVAAQDHKHAAARFELAKILLKGLKPGDLKSIKEVRDLTERTTMIEPGKIQYQILAGRVCQLAGDLENARMHFRTALKLDPNSDAAKRALAGLDSGDKKWVG